MSGNLLYYGDNLDVLRRHVKDESVDLIYLDPPFNSNQDYNVLFAEAGGTKAASQIKAFEDTWTWDEDASRAYTEIIEQGGGVADGMRAFRTFLGDTDLLAYLSMMAPRLVELRRVLKPTGSIYLHCDPTASHYLKMLMDAVFGPKFFKNEIVWHYRKWPAGKYAFQRNHDVLLFYAKTETRDRVFNQLYMDRAPSTLKRFGTAKIVSGHDEAGRRIPSTVEEADSEGVRMDDVWDIGRVPPIKQLYPTEKPAPLLERLIRASSNEGDVVLDPFCGCGTAVVAAHELKRQWIGIDITHLAVSLIRRRLVDLFGADVTKTFKVIGEPTDLEGARELAETDPYQFQFWILGHELVNARPAQERKGADKGIDGRIYFHDETGAGAKTKQVIISVKAGKLQPAFVQQLRGVMEAEGAEFGVLLAMNEPTKAMRAVAASAGFYTAVFDNRQYPRLQIITVADLIAGRGIDYPGRIGSTFKRASKATSKTAQTGSIFAAEDAPDYDAD